MKRILISTIVLLVIAFCASSLWAKDAQSKLNFVYESSTTKCFIYEKVGNSDAFYHIPCNKVPAEINMHVIKSLKKGCVPCDKAQEGVVSTGLEAVKDRLKR